MNAIEHFIFDFDGTISDSYPLFVKICHEIADEKGLPFEVDDVTLDRALKTNVKTGFCCLGWDKLFDITEFNHIFAEHQALHKLDFHPFPDAVALLDNIAKCGKKSYLYTHSGAIVKDMLQNMGLLDHFEFILDSSYGFPAKPAPDALLYLLERLGLDARSCMMIGDRPIDAQAGMNAGMLGCLWDADNLFPEFIPDIRVRSLLDIDVV